MKAMVQGLLRALHALENTFLIGLVTYAIGLSAVQIVLRNSGGGAIVWADQAINILVLWIAMAGAMVASRERDHISIDVISHYLGAGAMRAVEALTFLVTSAVCGVAAWYGVHFVLEEMEYEQLAFLNVPVWLCEAIIPAALLIIALRYLLYFVLSLFNALPHDDAVEFLD